MIEYIVIVVVVLIIFATIYYFNKGKGYPPKSCSNCRFYSVKDGNGTCALLQYQNPCGYWEWNGERNEKEA